MYIKWMVGLYRSSSEVNVEGIQTLEGSELAVRERIGEAVQFKASEVQL